MNRIRQRLERDYLIYGRAVCLIVDGDEEFRIVRIHPYSTTYIDEEI